MAVDGQSNWSVEIAGPDAGTKYVVPRRASVVLRAAAVVVVVVVGCGGGDGGSRTSCDGSS